MKFSTAAALFFAPSVLAFAPQQTAFNARTSLSMAESATEAKVCSVRAFSTDDDDDDDTAYPSNL